MERRRSPTAGLLAEVPVWPDHAGPWTEEDFLTLPETTWPRVELIDGSLLVSPGPGSRHQAWTQRLWLLLERSAPDDVAIYEGVNVRVRPGRIRIPDITVTRELGNIKVFQRESVTLVVEIISPGGESRDKGVKADHYTEAGIPWYLLVEADADDRPRLLLWRLVDGRYVEHARASCGETLALPPPLTGSIDPADLLRRPT